MFNTSNIEIVKCCQQEFCFSLPSVTLNRRTEIFLGKIRQCENLFVKRLLRMQVIIFCNITSYRCIYLNARVYSSFGQHVRLDCCVPQVVCQLSYIFQLSCCYINCATISMVNKDVHIDCRCGSVRVAQWLLAMDLRSRGRGFHSRPTRFSGATLGKSFTHGHVCLRHRPVLSCEGNRRSGVTMAMRHRHWYMYFHLRAHGHRKRDQIRSASSLQLECDHLRKPAV